MLLSWTSAGENRAPSGGDFTLADLNGDAHLDIVAGDANRGGVTVHFGQGNGTFAFGVGLDAAVALKGPELGGGHGAGAVLLRLAYYGNTRTRQNAGRRA